MSTPLLYPGSNELALPPNIHDLLDHSLVRAEDMEGANTRKYYVVGHPDLIVRYTQDAWPEDEQRALDSLATITTQGVSVLPHKQVEHPGRDYAYVVTKKVDGVPLDAALAENPSQKLLEGVDQTWASLVGAVIHARDTGSAMPGDITGLCQYMLGTIDIDPVERIRLVDLPSLHQDVSSDYHFTSELVVIANGVADVEKIIDKPLKNARTAILGTVDGVTPEDKNTERLIRAAYYVLENLVSLWPSEPEEIDELLAEQ